MYWFVEFQNDSLRFESMVLLFTKGQQKVLCMINEAIGVVFEIRCNVYRLQISTDSDLEVQKKKHAY